MALFKINKGQASNLPSTYTEGYCYFTTDEGKFYIDIAHGTEQNANDHTTGMRTPLNAHYTDGIKLGMVAPSSNSYQKTVTVMGVDRLFNGLVIAVKNNSAQPSTTPVYLKLNNITDPSTFTNDDGFRAVLIEANEPLRDEWKPNQVILLVYDKIAEAWNVIGGVSKVEDASTVSIYRYSSSS